MGITRQSVRATVKRLVADGLVELAPNGDQPRSHLVRLTEPDGRGHAAHHRRQTERVNERTHGIGHERLETAARVLAELCARLEQYARPARTAA